MKADIQAMGYAARTESQPAMNQIAAAMGKGTDDGSFFMLTSDECAIPVASSHLLLQSFLFMVFQMFVLSLFSCFLVTRVRSESTSAQRSAAVDGGNAAAIGFSLAQRISFSLQRDSARAIQRRLQPAEHHDQAVPATTDWPSLAHIAA